MSRAVIILLGLFALALLIFLCIRNHSSAIQKDIQNRTSNSLSTSPTDWAKVSTDGRNVVLTGLAPSESLRKQAETMALAVPGVVNVDNQITVAESELANTSRPESQTDSEPISIQSPYRTQFSKTSSGIILNGSVPDQEKRNALVQLAEDKFGIGNVTDQLELAGGAPENWFQIASAAINNLPHLKQGNADLTDSQLKLTGQVVNSNAKMKIEDNLKNQPGKDFNIDLDLTTPQTTTAGSDQAKELPDKDSAPSCSEQFEQTLANQVIHFSTDSTELEPSSQATIEKVLQFATVCPNSIIEIAGFTDSRGSETYNLTLSQNRAKAIASKLIKSGFSDKLLVKGYGETSPSSDNKTEEGQAKNRRIEFRYIQEGE